MSVHWDARAFVHSIETKVTAIDKASRIVAAESAHELEARVKKAFTQAHSPGTDTPSAPGTPPAVVTGTLRRSVHVDGPVRVGFGSYRALIGPTVVYARVQELGGGPSSLPKRPYFSPEFHRFLEENVMNRRLAEEIARALRV